MRHHPVTSSRISSIGSAAKAAFPASFFILYKGEMKCARKTRWHSSPESVPYAHTFACWLLSAGANLYFIASRMGHKNAQIAYGV
ncbi:hypothetical protein GA0061070_100790 [Kosakonia oryziphila]|uniref:Phage integrase family protein n=1 Tax=Kosakonia oryziphila TaxID=1005667 RepID=A0A1C4BDF7_9ENTR|nr:hypothetical protein GA0061070_100790 [Kosakonia oryziphila]